MKKLLLAIVLTMVSGIAIYAQEREVEIDGDKVLLNGKVILKYEKINVAEHSFFTLNDDEIISYQLMDNGTPKIIEDNYFIINFLEQKTKVESTNFSRFISGLGMNSRKNMQKLIGWLLKDKVLNEDGTLNPEKIETFFAKYNEDITNRTIRY